MTGKIKKLIQGLFVLALASIFIALGMWQLDRAQELSALQKEPVVQDQRIYQLSDLTSAQGSLPVASFGKSVKVTGKYIAHYKAPNQLDRAGVVRDWEAALLQVDSGSAILVLRGLWEDHLKSPEMVMSTEVTITGTLQPSQFENRATESLSELSRLDSSVLTAVTDYQLYDGFIAATSEQSRAETIERTRIEIGQPQGKVPGYYWQHISYVVIWWVMAALVLWAPFYKRREAGVESESAES
jgi:cytochrome oxidase assembly protein ShyY1